MILLILEGEVIVEAWGLRHHQGSSLLEEGLAKVLSRLQKASLKIIIGLVETVGGVRSFERVRLKYLPRVGTSTDT
jgi:hypothetical protein